MSGGDPPPPVAGSGVAPRLQSKQGRLVPNIMHFGRLLRAAGLPVGPAHLMDAMATVEAVGLHHREDVFWALHAAFVKRREEEALFREAFELFWKDPFGRPETLALILPQNQVPEDEQQDPMTRRLQDAWRPPPPRAEHEPPPMEETTFDASMTWSALDTPKTKDFDQMTVEEMRAARQAIRRMRFTHLEVPTRRLAPQPHGRRLDPRRMLRDALRTGGRDLPLRFRGPRPRPPPMVVIADISGSMDRYARMFLHFVHALGQDRPRIQAFVFGTQLWNITRWLRAKDVDHALAKVGHEVTGWSGGTRIQACLHAFNQRWSRRVLGQGAVVLLLTDGLDRSDTLDEGLEASGRPEDSALARETQRIAKSCRRLVWLNPLLRYDAFEASAFGVRAMLPHVHEFRPVHDLASLADLAAALDAPAPGRSRRLRAPGPR